MSSVHDHLNKLIAARPEIAPMASGLADNNPDYLQVVDEPARLITHLCGGDEARIEQALQGYIQFCDTFKQKQMDFLRNRRYGYTDYQRMNAEVYQDRDYMERVYYPALLFSYLFSSNYFDILRAFGQQFIPRCLAASGQSCEIGIGHGLLSALLLRSNRGLRGYGLDICPAARSMAERTSRFFGVNPPVEVRVADAAEGIEFQDNDVMICAEVMEHLPDPSRLLVNIHQAMTPDGVLFLTASMNMESVDHLYLFQSVEEVMDMVEASGFRTVWQDVAFLSRLDYRNDPALARLLTKNRNPATAILILKKKGARDETLPR